MAHTHSTCVVLLACWVTFVESMNGTSTLNLPLWYLLCHSCKQLPLEGRNYTALHSLCPQSQSPVYHLFCFVFVSPTGSSRTSCTNDSDGQDDKTAAINSSDMKTSRAHSVQLFGVCAGLCCCRPRNRRSGAAR